MAEQLTRQDVIDIITEYEETYGSALGDGMVHELTQQELTDENLRVLTIPGMRPDTQEWVQTSMKNMMRPINNAVSDLNTLKTETANARDGANQATNNANNAASEARAAITGAENVNATLVGMTVTVTDRNGVPTSVNIGFEIAPEHVYPSYNAMKDDAANVLKGQFCMIATTDPKSPDNAQLWSRNSSAATSEHPFTFLSDLDQAATSAFADWLDNYKPVIEADHTRAENDHSTASTDHGLATGDHSTAMQDHTTAEGDHATAGQDHRTATEDHTYAAGDHITAGQDHSRAESDHQTAGQDHSIATQDHTTADRDHTTATTDHRIASQDHSDAETAILFATTQGNRAKAFNDHPWEIRDDGFIWVWDETHDNGDGTYGAMIKTNKMIINFDDLTPEQQAAMVQEFLSRLTFDETPTPDSPNPVTSRGIRAALDQKQDNLTFASDQLCIDAAAEISFVPVTVEEPSGE